MYMWQTQSANIGVMFGIERAKDSSGSKTTSYFTVLTACNATAGTARLQTINGSTQGPLMSSTGSLPAAGTNQSTGNTGATTASFPLFPFLNTLGNPMLGFVLLKSSDVADGATVTVSQEYGSTHTYIASNNNPSAGFQTCTFGQSACLAMRYE